MGNKILKILFLIIFVFGIASGVYFSLEKNNLQKQEELKLDKIFENVQAKTAIVTSFNVYGDSLNITGKLDNVLEDNFENAKLIVTNGENELVCSLDTNIEEKTLNFTTTEINNSIEIENLLVGNYYILLRLKLNNSANAKYYNLSNSSKCEDIEYYTITKNGKNNKISIGFIKEKSYEGLEIEIIGAELPEEVYDIVIDAGHGGKDTGETLNDYTEADITLDYSKALKEKLEELGLKIKLTRDDDNSNSYTYTNMYDEGGRIDVACSSKAKYLISFHVNNGTSNLSGFEIYAPCRSNLSFAELMAEKISNYSASSFSNNTSFRKSDGVFVWNFTTAVIKSFEKTAIQKGYEPYNITTDTPYQYTIREIGGIATNAYADGRNTAYSANKYYSSNQGIEGYQIELGYIINDLENILNNKENFVLAIKEAIKEYLEL